MLDKKELTFPGGSLKGQNNGGERAKQEPGSENRWGSGLQFYSGCRPGRQTDGHSPNEGAPRPNPYSFKDNSWAFSTVWVFCGRFGDSRPLCLGKFVNSPNVIPWT